MSKCSSTSKRKRKLQTTGQSDYKKPVKKKMAWDSYTSIKDFGYEFNEEGRLVDIDGHGFNFYVCEEHSYNQQHYEMLGEVITEYVYELLQSEDVGLQKIEIPKEKNKKNKEAAKGFIFASEDFDKKERLLILVHGSGVVRAGQWARRLIINDCLDHGTQIPYIKQAIKEGYGVVVTNTNQNEVVVEVNGKKNYKTIKESESPEKHYSYVWKNIIEKTEASKMFLVGHSYGGYLIVDYFSRFPKILDRVVAVAFTDSVHSFHSHSRAQVRKWFLKNSVNWITSSLELDTPMQYQDHVDHITRVSAGTTKHEETSWRAMESVFKYFQNDGLGLESPNEENNKESGKSGGRKNRGVAANFDNKNNIVKHPNKGSVPPDLFCWSEDKSGSSCEQAAVSEGKETPSDPKSRKNHEESMISCVESTQEKSENSENTSEEQADKTGKKEETSNKTPEDDPDLEPTETEGVVSDAVQPAGGEQHIEATFIGSAPSGANQISTSDEITKISNEKDASSKNNDDTNTDSPEQRETNAEEEKRTASDPGDASNSEAVKKVVVKAVEAKDIMGNDASLGSNTEKPEENVDANTDEEKCDEAGNLDPLGKIAVVPKEVKNIGGTTSSVTKNPNEKETPSYSTSDATKNAADFQQEEVKPNTSTDEISDGVQSSNTENLNSNNISSELVNNEDDPSTALSDKQRENIEVNIPDKKSDDTSNLEPTRSVMEEKNVKENGASSGIITGKHEENVEMKSEDLRTSQELPIDSKQENVVDEKLKEKDDSLAINGRSQVKTTDDSSGKSEEETSV